MRTLQLNDGHDSAGCQYALRRGKQYWALVFEGREAIFKHELGALYVSYLLGERPPEPIHGVVLALKAREKMGQVGSLAGEGEQQEMGLEAAAAVRALWRRQRELERVLADRLEIEPVKAEALRELEEVTEFLRKSPWLSRHGAERCARAVGEAIRRFHARLAGALDAEGKPDEVLQAFARHLHEYLLVPSGRGCGRAGCWVAAVPAGCFTYEPPTGVVWEVGSRESKVLCLKSTGGVQSPESKVQSPTCGVQSLKSKVQSPESRTRRAAAVGYLSRFLCVGLAVGLLASGCAGPRPLKGGRAVTTHKPAGIIEQALVQSENPAQATKQDQASVEVRTYTVPAGSRVEQSQMWEGESPREPKLFRTTAEIRARGDAGHQQPSTLNPQPSTINCLCPELSHASRGAGGNACPHGAWSGAEGHDAGVGGQAVEPQGHCLGRRWPVCVWPGFTGVAAPQDGHR
ncbi:MAG: hypothetical protein NT154_40630 [Verrucomicrobia bacterium]|nr:hypothetical protein [Verrucomicrobiota bacterium]